MRPVSQPMGRCGEMWRDMGRCLLFRRGSDKLPPSGASLSSRLTPSALSGDTLDLLILGGYYGEGRRRSGAVSTFLMGVRAPPEAAKRVGGAAHPLFYPFCKVGTGYSLPQLRELRERLMPASLTRRRGNALGHGASLTAVSCEHSVHMASMSQTELYRSSASGWYSLKVVASCMGRGGADSAREMRLGIIRATPSARAGGRGEIWGRGRGGGGGRGFLDAQLHVLEHDPQHPLLLERRESRVHLAKHNLEWLVVPRRAGVSTCSVPRNTGAAQRPQGEASGGHNSARVSAVALTI